MAVSFASRWSGLSFFPFLPMSARSKGTANWISEFLTKYDGYDPHTTGSGRSVMVLGSAYGGLLYRHVAFEDF